MSLRQNMAARTPGWIRKIVRMAEHYGRRQLEWIQVLREMRGVSARDKLVLGLSAAASPLTSIRRLDGFEPPLLISDTDIVARDVGVFGIRSRTDDIIHVLNAREHEVRTKIAEGLNLGDIFVDAGANIGYFSVFASRLVGSRGRVVSFEMMPVTADRLRHNLRTNACDNATVFEKALSSRSGEKVRATSSASKFGQATIVAEGQKSTDIVCEVETITLDEALADVGNIAVMKMDLEGAEAPAIEGATQVLARTDILIFENNSNDQTVPDLLKARGFAIEKLDENNYLAKQVAS